ncbi:TetR/AcrR family transcriptional regulator [Novosphingobium sp. Gsoil 351]|uniref:TetR/AcrR family transcriptional regulator n=1 Tax=Novosphingobium sp. Gsoil 351 TaxID=2675225 RepID=UPI00351AD6F3
MAERKYHHGDLRAALLAEGLRLIEEADADALSLREVARAAGVSATAVYRHFPDKRALMVALAQEGVRRLGEAQDAAATGNGATAFSAIGRAYVRFALANPGLFRLTFTYPGLEIGDPGNDRAASLLHDHALELAHGDERLARIVALRAWALVHGLALLILDGRVPRDDALIDATIAAAALAQDAACP